jgi:UDP:flavonoid glycosyltransferase YjiC (YdhE family)
MDTITGVSLGRPRVNRLTHHVARWIHQLGQRPSSINLRRRHGLGRLPRRGIREDRFTGLLCAVSAAVVPPPADWPSNAALTGYWFDGPASSEPDPELARFVEAGDPPLYLGLGSMKLPAPEIASTLAASIQAAGRRVVVAGGLAECAAFRDLDGVYLTKEVDHGWLFPRTAGVICHGGAGTVAAGLRAGVPVMALPLALDQPYWGRRLVDLGVAPDSIPIYELEPRRLTAALGRLDLPAHRERSAAIAAQIARERGAEIAAARIEEAGR